MYSTYGMVLNSSSTVQDFIMNFFQLRKNLNNGNVRTLFTIFNYKLCIPSRSGVFGKKKWPLGNRYIVQILYNLYVTKILWKYSEYNMFSLSFPYMNFQSFLFTEIWLVFFSEVFFLIWRHPKFHVFYLFNLKSGDFINSYLSFELFERNINHWYVYYVRRRF